MLHVRDCPGTTASYDVCPFPWCRKVKHLLYHLISCSDHNSCAVCSNVNLNRNMRRLQGLNNHRGEIYQQVLLTKTRAKAEAEKLAAKATKQVTSKLDADSLELMVLDELKNDTDASKSEIPVPKHNSASETCDVATVNEDEIETPPSVLVSNSDVDYSIMPPKKIKTENDVTQPDAKDPTEVEDTAGTVSMETASKSMEQIKRPPVDILSDTNIVTDETMVLPATGSDQTLVHRNNASLETTDESESERVNVELSSSSQDDAVLYQSITPDTVKVDAEFCHMKIEDLESGSAGSDGKVSSSNSATIVSESTTVVEKDSESGAGEE